MKNNFHDQGEVDKDFHLKLAYCSKSLVMPLVIGPVLEMAPKISEIVRNLVDDAYDIALDFHQRIFEMIVAGDGVGAFNSMSDHMSAVYENSLIAATKMD